MSALQKGFYRLKQQVTETVDKTTNKTAALSAELVEVEENVRKIKIVYTDALKRAQESLVGLSICENFVRFKLWRNSNSLNLVH